MGENEHLAEGYLKVHPIPVLLFIILVNSVFLLNGKVIACPPLGGWDDLHNPSVPGGQVNFLVRAPSNPSVRYLLVDQKSRKTQMRICWGQGSRRACVHNVFT